MSQKITKKSATTITRDIDKLASTIQAHGYALGLDPKFASEMVEALDILANTIEHTASVASDIGKTVPGPLIGATPITSGHFTQKNFRQLSTKV